MQRQLSAASWPEVAEVHVRMGIHTGEASARPEALVGLDVPGPPGSPLWATVAKCSCPRRRQLYPRRPPRRCSSATSARTVEGPRPAGANFQLEASGLQTKFPPLRSLDNPELPNNLPSLRSAFIGRTAELSQVEQLVRSTRLVTLAGRAAAARPALPSRWPPTCSTA